MIVPIEASPVPVIVCGCGDNVTSVVAVVPTPTDADTSNIAAVAGNELRHRQQKIHSLIFIVVNPKTNIC